MILYKWKTRPIIERNLNKNFKLKAAGGFHWHVLLWLKHYFQVGPSTNFFWHYFYFYLEKAVVSHQHLLPPLLLADQPRRRPLAPLAHSLVSVRVMVQRRLPPLSMDVPLPLLHQTTETLVKTVINIKCYIERHVNYLCHVSQYP